MSSPCAHLPRRPLRADVDRTTANEHSRGPGVDEDQQPSGSEARRSSADPQDAVVQAAQRGSPDVDPEDAVVHAVRRWELSGGEWQLLGRRNGEVTIGLYTCDAHELMDRVTGPETPAITDLLSGGTASDA